jgi:L-alanine-DL-glutamate epimerase-like enolase superfamily enzyme
VRILEVRERTIPLSRYADPAIASGGLTTSLVAIAADAGAAGRLTGLGYASVGRFAQGGLIRERFAPRLLAAAPESLLGDDGALDPRRAWRAMMAGEKPGGHGERCVAVGTLDMALWDLAAKQARLPLAAFLSRCLGLPAPAPSVPVYAGGGYAYPDEDLRRLGEEMRRFRDLGFTRAKMKIGGHPLAADLRRVEVAAAAIGDAGSLAVDAMNLYGPDAALAAARALAPLGLWWFEDLCDPLDFATQAAAAALYPGPIAAGEALFSLAEARLLDAHGGLRRERDRLLFDPAHCYGLTHYLEIVAALTAAGWPRRAFWPHGGQLFSLHLVAALGLGGAEVNPLAFAPFDGLAGLPVARGLAGLPAEPGIGFERDLRLLADFGLR